MQSTASYYHSDLKQTLDVFQQQRAGHDTGVRERERDHLRLWILPEGGGRVHACLPACLSVTHLHLQLDQVEAEARRYQ